MDRDPDPESVASPSPSPSARTNNGGDTARTLSRRRATVECNAAGFAVRTKLPGLPRPATNPRPFAAHTPVMLLASLLLAATTAQASAAPRTEAEQLHRRGVQCMDEIERSRCAIDNFEALLDEPGADRELVTDAMLRLVRLHRSAGDPDAIKALLRRFWEVGMKRESRGHVPHSARFVPRDFDVLVNVDVTRVIGAPITMRLGNDARDLLFTCDEARRAELDERRARRRAERTAAETGRDVEVVLAEQTERERVKKVEREAKRRKSRSTDVGPIVFEAVCPVAKALGSTDLLGWQRLTGISEHKDGTRSVAIAQIPGLAAQITAAVDAGRLLRISDERWSVVDVEHGGAPVHVARLDLDELVIAPATVVDEIIAAHHARRRTMDRSLEQLVGKVPRDTSFFLVMTQDALLDLGFGSMKSSTRGFLQALLPKPKGMQVAGVLGEDIGVFTRVPTDNAVKGRALVSIARALIERQSDKDGEADRWLENLDIAEASDRRAVLATYLLSATQLERVMLE